MARKFKTKHSILRQQLIDEWRGLKSPDSIIPHKEISNEEMLMAVCLTEAIEVSLLTGRPVAPRGL